jgi:hypothetical protein
LSSARFGGLGFAFARGFAGARAFDGDLACDGLCASRLGGNKSIGAPVAVRHRMRFSPSIVSGRSTNPREHNSRTNWRVSGKSR